MIFEQAGTYMALDKIESIDSVSIQDKTFIPEGKVFYEVSRLCKSKQIKFS